MKEVRISKNMLSKLLESGDVWGKIYAYNLVSYDTETGTVFGYRYPAYYLNRNGDRRFNTVDFAMNTGMLEKVKIKAR